MSEGAKRLLWLVVVIVVPLALWHVHEVHHRAELAQAGQGADGDATAFEPSGADALTNAKLSEFDALLAKTTDPLLRLRYASSAFMGNYELNARSRAIYCREQGVMIAPFVDAYEKEEAPQYAVARSTLLGVPGITAERLDDTVDRIDGSQAAASTMKMAISLHRSLHDTCMTFRINARALAKLTTISKLDPMVYRILADAESGP